MKKILVVLLSMALILAFGMTASAVDVKFSGSFYVVGVYDNNPTLKDDGAYSRAFYYTRTRLQPVFEVAPGLTLTTRIDALEKQWGQTDWRGGNDDKTNSRRQTQNVTLASGQSPKVQENFEFERAYLTFKTAIGQVDIGYQSSGKWGTDFGDDENTRPRMRLIAPIGPIQILAVVEKFFDSDTSQQTGLAHEVNKDNDSYYLAGVYNFTGGNAGILFRYNKWGYYSVPVAGGFQQKTYAAVPYLKGTFGPVYVEAEFIYMGGKAKEFAVETATNKNVDLQGYGAWLYAKANVGPAYVGGSFLYSSGDDGSDATKSKTGPTSPDLNIGLILGRDELQTWEGSNGPSIGLGANGNAGVTAYGDGAKSNMMMASLFVGMNPTPKTNVEFMGVWAKRLEVPFTTPTVDKNLGYEFDLTASYKIYDNLTYMVGAGYLLTGDYFKGVNSAGKTSNDYLLLNKLTLSF